MDEERERQLLVEQYKRERVKADVRRYMFDKQLGLHDDPAQFRACHAGRRGGKSEGIPCSSVLDVLDAGFNEKVLIVAETQKKAKELHWANLLALVNKYNLPLEPRVQEGAFVTPWDARILFWGLGDNAAVELMRGFKMRSVRCDEVQFYEHRLPRAVSAVIEPALGDTGGSCTLYGTPSLTAQGDWSKICLGITPGWSVHHWDVRQNKKFPRDALSVLQQVLLRNKWKWDPDHPDDPEKTTAEFAREWLGLFVNDTGAQVYKYAPVRNEADGLPIAVSRGFCTLGMDYGASEDGDPCAWVVLWSPIGSREVYVVEAIKHYGMLPDDAAVITRELIERWSPRAVVGDAGGLGKPYVMAYNRRYGHLSEVYVQPADKLGRRGHIVLFNAELQAGRVKVLPAAEDLKAEWRVLPWNEKRTAEKKGAPNDVADAALYAFVAHSTDIPKKAPPAKTEDQLRAEALAERQKRARERSARGLLRSG